MWSLPFTPASRAPTQTRIGTTNENHAASTSRHGLMMQIRNEIDMIEMQHESKAMALHHANKLESLVRELHLEIWKDSLT